MTPLKVKTLSVIVSIALSAVLFSGCSHTRSPIPKKSYITLSFIPAESDKADGFGNSTIAIIRDGKVIGKVPATRTKDITQKSAQGTDEVGKEYKVRFKNGSCILRIYNGVSWEDIPISPYPCPPGI